MKTAIKLTALAVITVLVALACSPEVELTARDYSDRNESKNAGYTNSPAPTYFPTFSNNPVSPTINYIASTNTTVTERDREWVVTFPAEADITKVDNASIEARLKEFLSFSQYTNPATNPATANPPVVFTPSTLTTAVDYSFVRREGFNIYIKVEVPDIDRIVAKVDASKYRVHGQTLDRNSDGKTDIYDDQYTEITVLGATKTMVGNGSYNNAFSWPVTSITIITSGGVPGGSFTTAEVKPKLFVISAGNNANGDNNAYYRTILSDIVPKIEIQKYNIASNSWAKDETGTVALFVGGSTAPTGSGIGTGGWANDFIYGSITPEDLGIYRLVVKDIANLTTKENYGASSYPAKIRINVNGTNLPFYQNTYYQDPVVYNNTDVRGLVATNFSPIRGVKVSNDSSRRNVVLDVFFQSITDTKAAADVWLSEITLDEFNKNFKLVYNPQGNYSAPALNNSTQPGINIAEIKVVKIEYDSDKYLDSTITSSQINHIKITLDPSFENNGSRNIYLLLNMGFKYNSSYVTFGNASLNSYYNGKYFWGNYGRVPATSNYSPEIPAVPANPGSPEVGHWEDEDGNTTGTDKNNKPDDDDTWVVDTPAVPATPAQPAIPPSYIPATYLNL